jgi:phospholipase/carboxylesterase
MNNYQPRILQIEAELHQQLIGFNLNDVNVSFKTALEEYSAALLNTLAALESAIRQFHPPLLPQITAALLPFFDRFRSAADRFAEHRVPDGQVALVVAQLKSAAEYTEQAIQIFSNPPDPQKLFLQILRAMRRHNRAQESMFPLRHYLDPASRYFLEPAIADYKDWMEMIPASGELSGLMTLSLFNESDDLYWVYIPDHFDKLEKIPLVVALHGGGGSGRDFIWSWIREARSRNFAVLAPTSIGRTWSFQQADDALKILSAIDLLSEDWNIDADNILLTGFSDGAIYALTCGLQKNTPYSALAPISGVLHPIDLEFAVNRRIYLVHGRLDWMFKVEYAHQSHAVLKNAGADIIFHEIEDLSHTYPREENSAILRWFMPSLSS